MTGDPRWIRRLDAVYALALSLYPRRFRAHVGVVAGAALEGAQVDADVLESKVRDLRGDAA